MLGELLHILAAAIISWILFVAVDIFFKLPESLEPRPLPGISRPAAAISPAAP